MAEVLTPILVVAPASEPVTLAEMRGGWLKQDLDIEGPLIEGLITAAREWLERATDRQFMLATWKLLLPSFPAWIELPNPPLVAVTSITYLDADGVSQTLATTVYNVVTREVPAWIEQADGESWPITDIHPEAVTVTYTAGNDAPELAKTAIKLLAAHWYEHREGGDVPANIQWMAWALSSHRF